MIRQKKSHQNANKNKENSDPEQHTTSGGKMGSAQNSDLLVRVETGRLMWIDLKTLLVELFHT